MLGRAVDSVGGAAAVEAAVHGPVRPAVRAGRRRSAAIVRPHGRRSLRAGRVVRASRCSGPTRDRAPGRAPPPHDRVLERTVLRLVRRTPTSTWETGRAWWSFQIDPTPAVRESQTVRPRAPAPVTVPASPTGLAPEIVPASRIGRRRVTALASLTGLATAPASQSGPPRFRVSATGLIDRELMATAPETASKTGRTL